MFAPTGRLTGPGRLLKKKLKVASGSKLVFIRAWALIQI